MAKPYLLFTLHAKICGIEPPIWRRVEVEGGDSLRKLHHILQAAFGWHDAHLHEFEIGDNRYVMMDIEDMLEFMDPKTTFDDRKVKLEKVAYQDLRFIYRYDFGDCWDHDVVVEKVEIVNAEPDGCAYVVAGARACPPEDVGGPGGYQRFLETIRDRLRSEEARDLRRWAGRDFDAELFDRRAANAALERMTANGWGRR
jgi:hypothetical protein